MPPSPSEIMERMIVVERDLQHGTKEVSRIAATIEDIRDDFKDVVGKLETKLEGIQDKARLLFIGISGSVIVFLANQIVDIVKTTKGG